MAVPTTKEEWAALINEHKSRLPSSISTSGYEITDLSTIPSYIDHTLLVSIADKDVDQLCAEAKFLGFASVCVRGNHVSRAVEQLKNCSPAVGVACVVGFHEGTYPTEVKVNETIEAVKNGATELDMVMNYPQLKAGQFDKVYQDIAAVKAAAGSAHLKVIIETSALTHDEIIAATVITCAADAEFVKTSTGFNGPGASTNNVALMRAVCESMGKGTQVKASGGIKTLEKCLQMIRAGATRIGTSAGLAIESEVRGEGRKN
ncbi:deoxyribose-phosphate aldolase [Ascosphaera apis ARSEF 7405]|uniref:deoxyribose-phosphate aldolase n=1 Tax=Ascosphaera apis ARSEF 7405 TaxID=392613 RepID=A0A162IQQ8_9EURO|nr:deoxyribose-phosphate aldolase [Ascosphaera apis ARSEF 7405]